MTEQISVSAGISAAEASAGSATFVLLLNRIIDALGLFGGVLILFNSVILTYEVVSRYLFNAPTIWVMEVSIYCTLLSGFLSVAYALKEHAHVKVDFITIHMKGRLAVVLEALAGLLAISFVVVLGWEGFQMALMTFHAGEHSPTLLRVPTWIPQSFIPLGSAILLMQFVRMEAGLIRQVFADAPSTGAEASGNSSFSDLSIVVLLAIGLVLGLYLLKVSLYLGLLLLFTDLLLCGLPVAFALGLFGLFGFYFLFGGTSQLIQVPILAYATMDSNVMVALPLFILGASILRIGSIAPRIFAFANVLVRHLPGGLGIASVIFCGFFAAMTGSSVAVASALSLIALPELLAKGYNRTMVIGLLAAGGTLGILFPPSIAMMLYGAMTNESIGFLFLAGVIPGLILSLMFCFYVAWKAGRDPNVKREPRAGLLEIGKTFVQAAGGLGTIVIIMGGIYSGLFTPTESGGVACFYSLVICCFLYRTLPARGLRNALREGARINAMIMMIIIGANLTQQIVLMTQIPQNMLAYVQSLQVPSWIVILVVNLLLFILGMPLEAVSILVITVPILYPLITGFGYSGLWFAVVMVINMEMALISPPEGLNLFILQNLAKASAAEVSRGVIPFIVIMALFLVIICFFPSLATWLPAMMK